MEPYKIKRKPTASETVRSTSAYGPENMTATEGSNTEKLTNGIGEERRSFLNDTPEDSKWKPGSWSNFPLMGISALVLVILCIGGDLVVLMMSNGKTVSSWHVQPTVLLAIFSAVANTSLAFALAQGVTLSWWNEALKGTTVRTLHMHWKYGNSVWACLTKFGCFNTVALATIMTTFMVVDGPLLQRASTVVSRPLNGPISIEASIAPELPTGYTGYISDRGNGVDRLNAPFVQIMQDYINRSPLTSGFSGCFGSCSVDVPAAGLAWECSATSSPINYEENLPGPEGGQIPTAAYQLYPAFSVSFGLESDGVHPSMVEMTVEYANTTSCSGELVTKACNLTSAVLLYHVALADNVVTLMPPLTNLIVLAEANNTLVAEGYQTFSTLGGIYLAAFDLFTANVTLNFIGSGGYQANNLTTFASAYAGSGSAANSTCQFDWTDPTDDIIASLENIMFRAALQIPIELPNNTNPYGPTGTMDTTSFPTKQTLQGIDIGAQNFFKTQYAFMGAAAGVITLAVLTVLPLYYNFWQLGRAVSFSPIETAKAFNSPLLRDSDITSRNGEVDGLVKSIGKKRVRYGFVNAEGNGDSYIPQGYRSHGEGDLLMVSDE